MDERIKERIDYIKMLQVALECSTDPEDIEADNLMDAIWESKMELKELGYEGWEDLSMVLCVFLIPADACSVIILQAEMPTAVPAPILADGNMQ